MGIFFERGLKCYTIVTNSFGRSSGAMCYNISCKKWYEINQTNMLQRRSIYLEISTGRSCQSHNGGSAFFLIEPKAKTKYEQ